MAAFEGSVSSLLQGVSQQVPRERLPGQVSDQQNMLSDVVSGIRRRPGAQFRWVHYWPGVRQDTVRAWHTDLGGDQVTCLVNTTTGQVLLVGHDGAVWGDFDSGGYLVADSPYSLRCAVADDQLFLANVEQQPVPVVDDGDGQLPPERRGCFYIGAGAFSSTYDITLNVPGWTGTVAFETPQGNQAGDAAKAAPAYIAQQLVQKIRDELAANANGVYVWQDGAYVYLESDTGPLSVTTGAGRARIVTSGSAYFPLAGELPSRLPQPAHGWRVAVGDVTAPQYYRYDNILKAWLESAAWGSIGRLENMPVSIQVVGSRQYEWVDGVFEGSLAGDDESNPPHRFMTRGISGMGTYQGRLVLLSGPMVSLSAAKHPRRFFRTTVAQLVDGDPVEVGSNSNSSADYTHAVPFMKDLVLFSESYQALIPYTNTAITPRTATVVLTSQHSVDTTCAPTLVGRTLMYPIPRSSGTYGMLEMLPSPSTDSQYVSVDVTQHLPTFFPGRCRFGASSGVSGIAVFGSTTDPYGLYVHEYIWDGDTKAQQAWHRWEMPYPISDVYFVQGSLRVLVTSQDMVMELGIDPRRPVVGRHWEHAHPETPEQPPIRDNLFLASKLYPVGAVDGTRPTGTLGDGLLRQVVRSASTSAGTAATLLLGAGELRPPIVDGTAADGTVAAVALGEGALITTLRTVDAPPERTSAELTVTPGTLRAALVRVESPVEQTEVQCAFGTGELYEL